MTIASATYFISTGAYMAPTPVANYFAIAGISLLLGTGGFQAGMYCVGIPYCIFKLGLFAYDKCRENIKENINSDRLAVNRIKARIKYPIDEDEYFQLTKDLGLKIR